MGVVGGGVGGVGFGVLEDVVSAVGGVVGVEEGGVGSGGDVECVVGLGLGGVEVEAAEEVAALEGDDFVVFVYVEELGFVFEEVGFLEGVEHGLVEGGELVEFEVGVVAEGPLAAGVVVGPFVAFAGEVDPFGVSEFVAHEVEVSVVGGEEGEQAGHFVEGDAAVDGEVAGGGVHVEVHLFVDEFEDEGFAADEGLVVGFEVGEGVFFGSVGGEFVVEPAEVPGFVGDVVGEFEPGVGNAHGEAEVEAAAAFFFGGAEAGEAGDVFGDGDGVGANGVDEFVGEGEVGEGVEIEGAVEVGGGVVEGGAEAAVVVEHAGDAVEAEAVEVEFVDPVAGVGEEEVEDFGFSVVEAAGVPGGVVAAFAGVEVLVGGAVEAGEAFGFVFDGVGVDEVDDDGDAGLVAGVDE